MPRPGWYMNSMGRPTYWDGFRWRYDVPMPQTQPAAVGNPSAMGESEAVAHSRQGWFKAHKMLVIVVAAILALALACGGMFLVWRHRTDSSDGVYDGFRYPMALTTGDYDLQPPRLDCDWWVSFPLKGVETDTTSEDGEQKDGVVAAKVFTDADLDNEYPTRISDTVNDGTVLQADSMQTVSDITNRWGTDVYLYDPDQGGMRESNEANAHVGHRFYGYGGYFFVRYVGDQGQVLDKPQVTYFTVKRDVSLPRVTGIQTWVDDNGYLQLTWNGVEEADGYEVFFRYCNEKDTEDPDLTMRIAQTEEPKLDFSQFKGYEYEEDISSQNPYFAHDIVIDSSAEDVVAARAEAIRGKGSVTVEDVAEYTPDSLHVRKVSVLIRAMQTDPYDKNSKKYSAMSSVGISSLLGKMPLEISLAMHTLQDEARAHDDDDVQGIEKIRQEYAEYVRMADGTLARTVKIPDYDHARNGTTLKAEVDEDGKISNRRYVENMTIPCSLAGTVLTSTISFDADDFQSLDEFKAAFEKVREEETSKIATGLLETVHDEGDVDWAALTKDNKVVNTMPSEQDLGGAKISGSNELVKYIAGNLIAGNRIMDVTKYVSSNDPSEEVRTAFDEAIFQNPLTLAAYGSTMTLDQAEEGIYVLKVAYSDNYGDRDLTGSRDAYLETRDKVLDTVRAWQQDAPADKAEVVAYYHDRLAKAMTYDYAYFDGTDAHVLATKDTTGSAINLMDAKDADNSIKTVCSGYAQAMQLLMQQAGIDSYYVVGNTAKGRVSGSGHAWNLINTGEGYKATDVTWDDDESSIQRDYLQTPITEGEMGTRMYEAEGIPERVLASIVPRERIQS